MTPREMSAAYPRISDAPWSEIRLAEDGRFAFQLTTSAFGEAVLSGICSAEKVKKPLVFEKPFVIHGGYVYDLYRLHPELLPDLSCEPYVPRRLELTMKDGSKHTKLVSDAAFDRLAERLASAMQMEDRERKKIAREWNRAEYQLFAAIRRNEIDAVRAIISLDPSAVNAVAPKQPSDTKNFSPLMVALSGGMLRDAVNWHTEVNWKPEIAWFLLENGSDVNYREPKIRGYACECVLTSAAKNAVRNVRMSHVYCGEGNYVRVHTKEEADASFSFLKRMLELGANPNVDDTYGNTVLSSACFEASTTYWDGDPEETRDDIRRILKLLIDAGANPHAVSSCNHKSIRENYENEAFWAFCGDLFL